MNKRILFVLGLAGVAVLFILGIILGLGRFSQGGSKKPGSKISLSASLLKAKDLEAAGSLLEARGIYQNALADYPNARESALWQKKVEELNIRLLFSSAVTPNSLFYEVRPGDTLTKIAREYKTTTDLIKKSNNLSDDKIMPGRRLKVWSVPFSILVDKSENTLVLKTNEEVIKVYIVSTGKDNSTPVGTFKITTKLVDPTWFKSGAVIPAGSAENILGTRWLGFDLAGYGIHGTTEPENLGRQVTQGCVRMSNAEVEELYTMIPEGTEVTVVD